MKVLITRLSKGILYLTNCPQMCHGEKLNDIEIIIGKWSVARFHMPVNWGIPFMIVGCPGMSIKSRVTWPGHICQNVSKATLWDLSVHLLYVHTKTLWNTEILYFATLMCENLGKAHVFQHTLTNKEETQKKNTHNTYSETFAPPPDPKPPWRNDFTWINHSQPVLKWLNHSCPTAKH